MPTTLRRSAALLVAAALAIATATISPARAEAPVTGVGSSSGGATVAALDLGSLLRLAAIGETSSATIDPANGTPTATETLEPLTGTAAAIGDFSAPTVQTSSTGAADTKGADLVDLSTLGVPGLTGTVNAATLQSLVDAEGAQSSLSSSLANVSVLGGVANVDSASVDLGGVAGPTSSTATRAVTVDGVTVLDLRALLSSLGLDLNTLPLSTLTDLIDQLGLVDTLNALTGLSLPDAASLIAVVTGINGQLGTVPTQIAALQTQKDALVAQLGTATSQLGTATAQLAPLQSQLTAAQGQLAPLQSQLSTLQGLIAAMPGGLCVDLLLPVGLSCAQVATLTAQIATLNTTISGLTTQIGNLNSTISTLNATINSLNAQINALLAQIAALAGPLTGLLDDLHNLLDGVARTLELAPLLRVEGVEVGAIATAKDTVANSAATVTGAVGSVKIGGLDLGGLDATATVEQVQALASQLTGQLNTILGAISPQLANLVKIELLQQATDVSEASSYVTSTAGVTGLVATVTPPDICALLNDVLAQLPAGLNSLPGVTLPALPVPAALADLGSVVTCSSLVGRAAFRGAAPVSLPALLEPVKLAIGSVSSAATFKANSSSSPTQTPTTTTPGTTGTPGITGTPGTPGTTAGTPRGSLPRTGIDDALLAVTAALLALGALGTRRVLALSKR